MSKPRVQIGRRYRAERGPRWLVTNTVRVLGFVRGMRGYVRVSYKNARLMKRAQIIPAHLLIPLLVVFFAGCVDGRVPLARCGAIAETV